MRETVVVGPWDVTVGPLAISGAESSHPAAATIRRANTSPMTLMVKTPIRCLNANPENAALLRTLSVFISEPKLKPRWDLHFEGLEDYRKDPNTTAADQ